MKNLKNIEPFFVYVGLKRPQKTKLFSEKVPQFLRKAFLRHKIAENILMDLVKGFYAKKKHLSLHLLCLCYFLKKVKICKVVKGLTEVNFCFFFTLDFQTTF
jgi:hypothetical protein